MKICITESLSCQRVTNVKLRHFAKRAIPVWFLLFILLATVAGTALALNITTVTKRMNIYNQSYENTDFTLVSADTFPKGQNKVTVNLVVHNSSGSTATCEATVQLLGINGEIISISGQDEVLTYTFVNVQGGSNSNSYTFTFTGAGLVAQYVSTYIILTQSG